MNLLLTNLTLLKAKLGTLFNHLLNRKPVIMSCSDTIVTKETGTFRTFDYILKQAHLRQLLIIFS